MLRISSTDQYLRIFSAPNCSTSSSKWLHKTSPKLSKMSPNSLNRGSLLSSRANSFYTSSSTLALSASPSRTKRWRDSEEARIIRRLGGPWQPHQMPASSPTESSFSKHSGSSSPAKSIFSHEAVDGLVLPPQRQSDEAPSIPDVVGEMNDGGWTPRIDWEFRSPRRFLSLKKRSMVGLTVKR